MTCATVTHTSDLLDFNLLGLAEIIQHVSWLKQDSISSVTLSFGHLQTPINQNRCLSETVLPTA